MRAKLKGKRRECFCGTKTNRKLCPECGEYAPILVRYACPYCRIETKGKTCPECGRGVVCVDKDGFYYAHDYTKVCMHCGRKTTDNFCSCGEQTIKITGANWMLVDDVHLFLKNLFARFFEKCTISF